MINMTTISSRNPWQTHHRLSEASTLTVWLNSFHSRRTNRAFSSSFPWYLVSIWRASALRPTDRSHRGDYTQPRVKRDSSRCYWTIYFWKKEHEHSEDGCWSDLYRQWGSPRCRAIEGASCVRNYHYHRYPVRFDKRNSPGQHSPHKIVPKK